jgi:energy-coupling factor transporter transmembrane protein EcfT
MAELKRFSARRRLQPLAHLDVRLKLALMFGVSPVGLNLGFSGLALLVLPLILLLALHRPAPGANLKDLRWIAVMLALVLIARALLTDGEPWMAFGPVAATREGLREGALTCLRLILMFMLGAAFIVTTPSAQIKAGVQWFLKPIPFVPAERVATMLSLIIRFIPVILEQAALTSAAQRARGVENRRNPVRRTVLFGMALLRHTLATADNLAVAMEARCYSDQRTDPELKTGRRDWVFFGSAAGLVMMAAAL